MSEKSSPIPLAPGENATLLVPFGQPVRITFSVDQEHGMISRHASVANDPAPTQDIESGDGRQKHWRIPAALALRQIFSAILGIPSQERAETTHFSESGDSLNAIAVSAAAETLFGIVLDAVMLFYLPTLSELLRMEVLPRQDLTSEKARDGL